MEQLTEPKRLLGAFNQSTDGPTLIVIGGVHGNEPAGVQALERVVNSLAKQPNSLIGNFYAIAGNLAALKANKRFLSRDLNRIWNEEHAQVVSEKLKRGEAVDPETKEHFELFSCLQQIVSTHSGPFYFVDLHTVSSQSAPFVIINDMLINRRLATKLPVPVILGIEEYVSGSMLNRINKLGYVGIGIESGFHDDPASVTRHESFIWLILKYINCLSDSMPFDEAYHREQVKTEFKQGFFELKFRYTIKSGETFRMNPGYVNFQEIDKGEHLANNQSGEIVAPRGGRIFMPLYQNSGNDGFFIIRKVPRFALRLSAFLRKINFESLLTALPGVRRVPEKHYQLIVDLRIAKFLALDLFHLLGYRQRKKIGDYLLFTRREFDVKAKVE